MKTCLWSKSIKLHMLQTLALNKSR